MDKTLEDKIAEYVSFSLFFTTDLKILIGMVILHFDISEKRAEKIVMEYLSKYNPVVLEINNKEIPT